MPSAFLMLHGLGGSGPEHWQRWLGERLRGAGHGVQVPDLPEPDAPDPSAWERAVTAALAELEGDERVVICHSLSCLTWLAVCGRLERPVDRVALVAPPSAAAGVPEILSFFPITATAADVARAAGETRLVCSDNDRYCPEGAAELYGEPLALQIDLHPGGGHLNVDSGFGPWPAMEAWAQGAKNGVET
jgi:predicted alpha/beta hydrolase family esterase